MLFNYGRPHPAPGAAAPAAPCVWLRSPLLSFPAPRPAARGSARWRRRLPAALPPRVLERGRPRLAPGVGGAGCAPGGGGPPCRREAHDRNAPLFSLKAAFLSRAFLGATACLGCRWPASAPPPPAAPVCVESPRDSRRGGEDRTPTEELGPHSAGVFCMGSFQKGFEATKKPLTLPVGKGRLTRVTGCIPPPALPQTCSGTAGI